MLAINIWNPTPWSTPSPTLTSVSGATNLKGYTIGGNLGLSNNVWLTARYMSANAIAGPPFAVDIVQVDLNARF